MRAFDVNNVALTSVFNNQIAARERVVRYKVFVDWDRTGFDYTDGGPQDITEYVIQVDTDRAVTTDLPAQTRITAGAAAGTATITLGGGWATVDGAEVQLTGAQLWPPYFKQSPFYGKKRTHAPVQIWFGLPSAFGPDGNPSAYQYVYWFTGKIRSKPVTTANSTVSIECVDGSEDLHGKTRLPMVLAGDAFGIDNARYGLNSQWVIDYILRRNGIYASPPTTADTVASTTMHGSMFPEVGNPIEARIVPFGSTVSALESPPFVPGLFGLAVGSAKPDGGSVTPSVFVEPVGKPRLDGSTGGIQVEWVQYVPASYGGTGVFSLQHLGFDTAANSFHDIFVMDDGRMQVWLEFGSTVIIGPNATNGTAAWRYLGVHIKFNSSTSVTVTFNVSGVTTSVTQTVTDAWPSGRQIQEVYTEANAPLECMMWKYRTTPSFTWMTFVPNATLEVGLNQLKICPYDPEGTDAWQTITDIAAAELGYCGFTEEGIFRFYNRNHRNTAFSYTFPAKHFMYGTNTIKDVQTAESIDGVRNAVTATATPYVVQGATWLWTLAEPTRVPARQTLTIWASFQSAGFGTPGGGGFLPAGAADPSVPSNFAYGQNWYRASSTRDGKGQAINNLTMTVTPFADSAKIEITNPNRGLDAWLVHPSRQPGGADINSELIGQPCLLVWGRAITDSATTDSDVTVSGSIGTTASERDEQSIKDYGEQAYDIASSKWIQDVRSARDLVLVILCDLCRPIPQVPTTDVIMEPRLQLIDSLCIVTEGWDGINTTSLVMGIHSTLTKDGGASQSILPRLMCGPEGWVLGDSTWPSVNPVHVSQSILGVSTILGGKV